MAKRTNRVVWGLTGLLGLLILKIGAGQVCRQLFRERAYYGAVHAASIRERSSGCLYIDLRRADLSHRDLRGVDLSHVFLNEADLQGADLRGASLVGTRLRGADFRGADLRGARLLYLDLTECLFDRSTRWPSGFNPRKLGAREVRR